MRAWMIAACFGLTTLPSASGQGPSRADPPRMVLVELFTSQGCDMCPEAERVLGVIAAKNPRVVPIALHVDYFNDPWKDPFSDKLHSEPRRPTTHSTPSRRIRSTGSTTRPW